MIYNEKIAFETAAHLLQINAIKLEPKNPFTWASGWKSPIYCDNRLALSFPEVRTYLTNAIAQQVTVIYGTDVTIAGVATGAIGIGALVAQKLNLSFVYVRPEPKKHGRQNQIEGKLAPNQKVVVIEDLISTGKSSLNAVNALRDAGNEVLGMLALFTYEFPVATEAFEKNNLSLQTLCNYYHLLETALHQNKITESEAKNLSIWREDPANWTP